MKLVLTIVLYVSSHLVGLAQGTFRNLDFEEATLPPPHGGLELIEDALPGWSVSYGDNVQTGVFRNYFSSGGISSLSIMETRIYPIFPEDYYVMFARNPLDLTPVSLYQTGQVPRDALSLRFDVVVPVWVPGDLQVELNGTPLDLQVLSISGISYTIGADASAFAGQTVELRLISRSYVEGSDPQTSLDNIEFSPLPVPEPSIVALLVLGAGGLFLASWRRRTGR